METANTTTESPLDVLSRAATMVQSNNIPPSYRQEGGGGKWRRSKPRKPPPQYPAEVDSSTRAAVHSTTRLNGEPIDLSTRRIRVLPPPSYTETMAKQQIWLSQGNKEVCNEVSSTTECTQALCDPMIDEHFRRSLGQGYLSSEDDPKPDTTLPSITSLSVDDHFAKSLGDRWLELQQEEEEAKQRSREASQRLITDVPV